MFQYPYIVLLFAFVERWQQDTNTSHMTFGEITITLHDMELKRRILDYGGVVDAQYFFEQIIGIVHSNLGITYTDGGINSQDLSYIAEDSHNGLSP